MNQSRMRSEQEMLELILSMAKHDERIRAVILNGSRTNPNAPHDIFQDYDIVYLVTDVEPYKADLSWIARFGELMILQMPDLMGTEKPADRFTYLMQFMDGNRIDLTVLPLTKAAEQAEDSLSILLLDKDGIVPPFAPAHAGGYLPKRPTAKAFFDCCNEFWWLCPYVAKGLWREELPYARTMLDEHARGQLMIMLTWYVGVRTDFTQSPGKLGKYLKLRLEPELWSMFERTYADAGYAHTLDALMVMCELFRTTAVQVAAQLGFDYPYDDDARVSAHLKHVRQLPKDAERIYSS